MNSHPTTVLPPHKPTHAPTHYMGWFVLCMGFGVLLALWFREHRQEASGERFVQYSFPLMGTWISVQAPEKHRAKAKEVVTRAFREVDQMMSEWKPRSPLAAVNRAAGKRAVVVPLALFKLLQRSVGIGKLTEGAFDVTWAALWGLWRFKPPHTRIPTAQEIKQRLPWIDYRKLQLEPRTHAVMLPSPLMKLGLGGIAKGYALQLAAKRLQRAGLKDFLLSAGGHVLAIGHHNERLWRVGLRDPRGPRSDPFAYIEVTGLSVSTSGDYERFFMKDGVRYHHILDPRTGQPARGLRSATVVCPDAILADALSTALIVLGPKRGMKLIEAHPHAEAVLIDPHAKLHISSGLQHKLHLLHPPRP